MQIMNSNENSSKISLSMLRGKSSTQRVPSISFRFNSGSDDLIKIYEKEEKDDLLTCSIPELSPDKENAFNDSRESSPSRRESRSFSLRSSSLDDSSILNQEIAKEIANAKSSDTSSLISRLTKTFEDKINEIRSEKQKERDSKLLQSKDSISESNSKELIFSSTEEKTGFSTNKAFESMKKFSLDSKDSQDASSSPSKSKTTLVQDFTEQTNKLKSDFNKSIRPKISELRNRKSGKDNSGSPKIKSSLFQSLLGRDDVLVTEEILHECHAVDMAVEAFSDGQDSMEAEKEMLSKFVRNESVNHLDKKLSDLDVSVPGSQTEESVKDNRYDVNLVQYNPNSRDLFKQFLQEIIIKGKSINSKYGLGLFFLCFLLPIPRFLAGAIFGAALIGFLVLILFQFLLPEPEEVADNCDYILPDNLRNDDNLMHVGWMNELDDNYYPESYHVSQTHTVLLRLQGSTLQVDNSRKKINKHARPNEDLKCGGFVYHREYDLSGSEIVLLPKNLPRKWLFSRKYPIFIKFQPKAKGSPQDSRDSTPTKSFQESFSRPQSPDELDGSSESTEGNCNADNTRSCVEDDGMTSSVDMGSYEEVTQAMCHEAALCLFARTDREKDDWFRRFVSASEMKAIERKNTSSSLFVTSSTPEAEVSIPFEATPLEGEPKEITEVEKEGKPLQPPSYEQHMSRIMDRDSEVDVGVSWFNGFVGRVLFDFLRDKYWANKIQERVQRKLSKLHIPYFVGEIVVSGIELGSCVPQLISAGRPTMDHRGLWVDLNVAYSGSFRMTIETKLDLMKLKVPPGGTTSNPPSPSEAPFTPYTGGRTRSYARSPSSDCVLRNVQFDTDTDDSVESSSEEEQAEDDFGERAQGGGPASRRFLRIVDTVAASRYFQQVSEWRLLQKAMKGVSNTRIELGVEVRRLKGILALNIPPAPSDRLWYGFRGSPELVMVAKPCLGDRQLDTLPFLADFIQKQLRTVFEKVFVLPNMDDLVIPIMSPILPGQQQPQRPPWDHQTTPGGTSSLSPKASPSRSNISLDLNQSFLKLSKALDESV